MSGVRAWRRLAAVLSAPGLAALVAAACFSERTSGVTVGGECQVPLTVVDSQHVLVAIRSFRFAPDSIRVPAGVTVTWLNCEDPGTAPHTSTSTTGLWDSSLFPAGARYSRVFGTTGAFPYFCAVHPFMTGKVVVQ